MNKLSAHVVRVYHTGPIHGACSLCLQPGRLTHVDLDREQPICATCVPFSVAAAGALRAADIVPPSPQLTLENPI